MRFSCRQKAQGEATAFDKVYEQYRLAPEVTRRRMYYETMEQVLSKVDKTIVEAPGVTPYLPLPQVQKPAAAAAGAAAVIGFIRRQPIAVGGHRASWLLIVLLGSFPIVPETKQAVVVRFGKPVRMLNRYKPGRPIGAAGAGIIFRIPFVEQIVWIDKRVQDVDMQRQQVLSTDQRRLEVDAFARYRIVDPLLMYIRAGDRGAADASSCGRSSARKCATSSAAVEFASLLTPERQGIMDRRPHVAEPRSRANMASRSSTSASSAPTCPTARRSKPPSTACARRASRRRARSSAQGAKQAQIIRAEADAEAAQTYAASFGKDPEFYDFYRAMQSYQTTFIGDGQDKPCADDHHLVAAQRLFEGIHWTRAIGCVNPMRSNGVQCDMATLALLRPTRMMEYR